MTSYRIGVALWQKGHHMSEMMKWEFPFPEGDGLIECLKVKQKEYNKRLVYAICYHPTKPVDLLARFHLCEDESDSDFRLLYLKLVMISAVIAATDNTPLESRNCVALHSRYVTAELSPMFRLYQFPDDFNNACQVVHDYLTGVLKLESSNQVPTQPNKNEAAP